MSSCGGSKERESRDTAGCCRTGPRAEAWRDSSGANSIHRCSRRDRGSRGSRCPGCNRRSGNRCSDLSSSNTCRGMSTNSGHGHSRRAGSRSSNDFVRSPWSRRTRRDSSGDRGNRSSSWSQTRSKTSEWNATTADSDRTSCHRRGDTRTESIAGRLSWTARNSLPRTGRTMTVRLQRPRMRQPEPECSEACCNTFLEDGMLTDL
jgi:hypothetical protein